MKPICKLIIATFIVIIQSCASKNEAYLMIKRADDLLDADSVEQATMLFQQMDTSKIKQEEISIYYSLIQTIIAFRNYEEINSDSVINLCADYYQKNSDETKYAKARYYQSFIQYELNKTSNAVINAKIAEDIAEQISDYKLLNKIYMFLSSINLKIKNFDLAINYARKQIETAEQIKSNKWKAYAYLYMVIINNDLCNDDSVSFYIDKCLSLTKYLDFNDNSYLYSNFGEICLKSDTITAENYFLKALSYKKLPETYANLYSIYRNCNPQKASLYKDSALANASSPRMQIEILRNIAKDDKKVLNYAAMSESLEQIIKLQDTLLTQKHASEALELQKKYDFEKQSNIFHQRINMLMYVIVCLISIATFIYIKRKNRENYLQKEKAEAERKIAVIEAQNAKLENERLEMECKKAVNEKNKKEEEMRNTYIRMNFFSDLQNTLNWYNEQLKDVTSEKQKQALSLQKQKTEQKLAENLALCQNMYNKIKDNKTDPIWNKEMFDLFVGYYENINPKCKSFFLVHYENLVTIDKLYLILSHFENKTSEQICAILAWSDGTIRSRRSKIKTKQILDYEYC